jgi:hypothetical protein
LGEFVGKKDLDDVMEGRSARIWTAAYGRNEGVLRLQASYDSWPGALRGADGRLFFAMQSQVANANQNQLPRTTVQKMGVVEIRVFSHDHPHLGHGNLVQ